MCYDNDGGDCDEVEECYTFEECGCPDGWSNEICETCSSCVYDPDLLENQGLYCCDQLQQQYYDNYGGFIITCGEIEEQNYSGICDGCECIHDSDTLLGQNSEFPVELMKKFEEIKKKKLFKKERK